MKTRVLIAVKTYPSISSKYEETVCTAGFLEDGTWIRIYPIPFRKLSYESQYKKYQWVEMDLEKNLSDFRPESYRPVSIDKEPIPLDFLDTNDEWKKRKEFALKHIHTNLTQLIEAAKDKTRCTSLAVFKPAKIIDFLVKPVEREWDKDKLANLEAERKQMDLFKQPEDPFQVVDKLPYEFSYHFCDDAGKESKLMIEDWEIGQLFWNCLKKYGNEERAVEKVREKYFDHFAQTKDLHFFLGTTKQHHFVARNPFIIIGVFYPPHKKLGSQTSLFGGKP
jgi:hypothetical protein